MFDTIPPAQWEHIAYFFAGVIASGIFSAIAFFINQRILFRDIAHNSDKQIKL